MTKKEIPKAYHPQEVEDAVYKKWEESGKFNPDNLELPENAERFSISMPPPNATGVLHLGHASFLTHQDLMIRYNRMKQKNTLWLPGTDHASIATQTKVEKIIAKEGKTKYDLGRKKFLERVNEYVENSQNTIKNQTRRMGSSCNWSRERYTLDSGLSRAVKEVFAKMYNDELIYRGDRIVNWCPRCESTLADDEVEHKDQKAKLYYFKYDKNFPITIATTRPETKLGDTAVAVNPKDERYQKYIGKVYEINLGNGKHKIKIISDREVEMNFGTGALGVTPAHSMTDWEMAEKNDLEKIKIIGEDGKMNNNAGKDYEGLTVLEAREKIVEYFEKNNLIEKVEEVDQSLSICYRCDTPIEPLPSKQWFVAVDKKITIKGNKYFQNKSLKEVALGVVKNKEIKIIPERFEKTYFNWMENLHDWCISRQLWFGHQIPAWFKTKVGSEMEAVHFSEDVLLKKLGLKDRAEFDNFSNNILFNEDSDISWAGEDPVELYQKYIIILKDKGLIDNSWIEENRIERQTIKSECFVGENPPEKIGWIQDPDTLDTWFSSGLWTFSTLLNQDHEKYKTFEDWVENSPDLKKFHPTSVMETGYDILFFWVARMILMTTYTLGEVPFENVYLHGMVRDKQGKKMSKSLGNGIDPIEMIEKYGTDALRLSIIIGSSPGNDIKMYEEKIEGYRNFVNKLWNVSRYITMNQESRNKNQEIDYDNLTLADKWILENLNNLIKEATDDLDNYRFSQAGEKIKEFTWNDFADWYLEISKIEKDKDEILIYILKRLLILAHPFVPFVTEEIWKNIGTENLLITEKWSSCRDGDLSRLSRGKDAINRRLYDTNAINQDARDAMNLDRDAMNRVSTENDFEIIQDIVKSIRNARAEYKIEPSQKIEAVIYAGNKKEFIKSQAHLIKNLRTGIDKLEIKEKGEKIKDAVYVVVNDIEIYLIGIIDKEKERKNLEKEIADLEKYTTGIRAKLSNDDFIANAPITIVEKERKKFMEGEEKAEKLEEKLKSLLN
ncbi:valine--tRNA ligase [Candidatus Parcubacteria bacterium]|nr:valine--tRNA ligase [Candidatus Parcubacteria bacterium]